MPSSNVGQSGFGAVAMRSKCGIVYYQLVVAGVVALGADVGAMTVIQEGTPKITYSVADANLEGDFPRHN